MDLVTNEEVQKYLGTTEDYSDQITRASAVIRNLLQNPVIIEELTEYHDGGYQTLVMEHFPILRDSVEIRDANTGEEVDPSRYFVRGGQSRKITYRSGIWSPGMGRWEVTYQAGLAATTAEVPADIKKATLLLIEDETTGGAEGMKKETIGDYSYEMFAPGEASGVEVKVDNLLARYKMVNI